VAVVKRRRVAVKKESIVTKTKNVIFSSQGFPLILSFAILGILFVLFRMKGVELDYKVTNVNKDIERTVLENKELKARKAKLLSSKKLRTMARKYGLSQPKQEQIIVIP
jgi:cell division protein FtsL